MARVPQYGTPQVQARVTPNVRIDDSGAQQMRQAGNAIAQGAQDVARAGFGIGMQMQEQANTARLMEAQRDLDAMELELLNDPEKGAFATQGKDAMGVHQRVLPEYDRRAGEITGKLPPVLQAKFTEYLGRRRGAATEQLMRHSLRGAEQFHDANEKATIASIQNRAVVNYADPKAVDTAIDEGMVAVNARIQRLGLGDEAAKFARQEFASKTYRGVVERLLTSDPNAAQERLDATRSFMLGEDVALLEDKLSPIFEDMEYEGVAETVLSGGSSVAVVPQPRGKPSQAVVNAIEAASIKHGVPAHFLYALAEQESAFNPKAYNAEFGASGIMQYIPGTAADRGIDPFDVNQAIDAAAKDFAARMKAGGVDEAIMSHFAGPGGGNRGPKTERYLAEVKGRAARWAGEAKPERQAPPATLGDALGRLKDDPRYGDPRWRRGAQAAVTRAWSIKERDEADRDSQALESMRVAVEAAPAGMPLSRIPGVDYGLAVRKGWTGTLESIRNAKASGVVIETNAVTYDRFARLAVTNPTEFAKPQTRLEIMQAAGELGTADLGRLLKTHADFNKPDTRDKAIADHQSESQRMAMGLRLIGLDPDKKGDQEQAAQFGVFFRQARQAAIANNGGKALNPQQEDELVRRTAAAFKADPNLGRKALSAEQHGAVGGDYEAARQVLIARGNPNPTREQVQAAMTLYYRASNAN